MYVCLYPRVVPLTQVRAHMSLHPNYICKDCMFQRLLFQATVKKLQFRYSEEATDSLQLKNSIFVFKSRGRLRLLKFFSFEFFQFRSSFSLFLSLSLGIRNQKTTRNFPVFRLISHFFCNILFKEE